MIERIEKEIEIIASSAPAIAPAVFRTDEVAAERMRQIALTAVSRARIEAKANIGRFKSVIFPTR